MNHRTFAVKAGSLLAALTFAATVWSAEVTSSGQAKASAKSHPGANFVSVVKDGINLRSAPETAAAVLFQLPAGYPLQVLERKGDWLHVSDYENDKGWIAASVVSNTPYVIVKAAKGNIRAGAGTDSPQVGKVVREVILKKLDHQGSWVKVSHPQLASGWINRQLVWP